MSEKAGELFSLTTQKNRRSQHKKSRHLLIVIFMIKLLHFFSSISYCKPINIELSTDEKSSWKLDL